MLLYIILFIYLLDGSSVYSSPVTSLQDQRKFLFVHLENHLQVLLIHDNQTEKVRPSNFNG
jgi:hypothetical protein